MYTFEEIIGYKEIKAHFQNGIKLGKISHAYILNGEKGMGKKLLSYTFSKTLQCLEMKEDPCNVCMSCQLIESANHPDIITVTSTKSKSIGVDDIREQINKDIHIKPYKFKYKIYIVNEADKMTEQAQNALLKTIEEPPEYAIFFLLTNNINQLLPTMLSRCVVLNLRPIEDYKIKDYLMSQQGVSLADVDVLVAFSQGIIGRAKELADSDVFKSMRQECLNLLNDLQELSIVELLERVNQLDPYKEMMNECLDIMVTWYRDLLIVKSTKCDKGLIHKDQFNSLLKASSFITYNKIGKNIKMIESTKQQFKYNVNFQLNLEALLMKIKES
jgi:DNA polymerase-3 subunit delta'